jgi:RNA polymerase sigma factor (sigma-70 family)
VAVLIDGVIIESEIVNHFYWIEYEAKRVAWKSIKSDFHEAVDDMKQEGIAALLALLPKYEADQEATFYSYVYQRVKGAMWDWVRKWTNLGRNKDKPRLFVESDSDRQIPGFSEKMTYHDSVDALIDLEQRLFNIRWPKRERAKAIMVDYIHSEHQEETAARFGITGSAVCQLVTRFRRENAA